MMVEVVGVPLGDWGENETRWVFPLESISVLKWVEGTLEIHAGPVGVLKILDKDRVSYDQLKAKFRGGY